MGVYSDGSYGIQPGLIYSFPVTCEKGEWSIVQGRLSVIIQKCYKYCSRSINYVHLHEKILRNKNG